jgi:DNA-directed RNA polymerase subunit beta'
LKTADSGYLTRRLVDASSDTIAREMDCGTSQGVEIDPLRFSKAEVMESIEDRIYGRVTAAPIVDPASGEIIADANQWITRDIAVHIGQLESDLPFKTRAQQEKVIGTKSVQDIKEEAGGRVLVKADEMVTPQLLDALRQAGIHKIRVRPRIVIRSPMTCETANGLCQLCYGYDMSNHRPVALGTAVGVIAAQSVGEPGTQLTMRTFHTGGVAGEDITQGLPRAEELFEARKTTKGGEAGISPLDGYITNITSTTSGEDQVEITGESRAAQLPAALVKAESGAEIDINDLIDPRSPCKGEVYFIQGEGGAREMLVIDTPNGDRAYVLPPGARAKAKNRAVVSEGDALTERFNIDPIVANRKGKIELSETQDRVFLLTAADGETTEHEIPYGARLLVEPGDSVEEGAQLTSRSKPIFISAEGDGTVVLLPDRILVYNPSGQALRIPLTSDVSATKGHGEAVRAGEALVRLEIQHTGHIRVESLEIEGDVAHVRLQPRSVVAIDKAVTVRVGDKIEEGDLLSKGVVAPHTLLEAAGVQKARQYLLNEIHKVYKQQGVDINDKHLEVIIRQILNNVRIVDRGDSRFLLGDLITLEEFRKEVEALSRWNREAERIRAEAMGTKLAEDVVSQGHLLASAGDLLTEALTVAARRSGVEQVRIQRDDGSIEIQLVDKALPDGERELLRISKAALQTKGWLSAASFQRTTKVLAEAALRGETDNLDGLKPSIIVGKRIPSGTGFVLPVSDLEETGEGGRPGSEAHEKTDDDSET